MAFPLSVSTIPDTAGSETLLAAGGGLGLSGFLDLVGVDLMAVETKLGTGSSTPSSGKVLRATGSGISSWGAVDLTTDVTGTLPVGSGGTGSTSASTGSGGVVLANSPTIVTPTIASLTNANHDHTNSAGGGTLGANTVDTTQLVDESVTAAKTANRTRRSAPFNMQADGSGGVVASTGDLRPAITMTGTPSTYARSVGMVPSDYVAGTDATLKYTIHSDSVNSSETFFYYTYCQAVGDVYNDWNVHAAATKTVSLSNVINEVSVTISSSYLAASNVVGTAVRFSTALTGTLVLLAVELEYTADS